MNFELLSKDAQSTLEKFKQALAETDTQWEQIGREREKLKAGITGLEQYLGTIALNRASDSRSELSVTASSSPITSKNTFKNMSIVGAAYKYLRMLGRGVTNRELVDALLKGGLKTKANNPADTIRTLLQRNKETFFWHKEERLWKLVEWGPATEGSQE